MQLLSMKKIAIILSLWISCAFSWNIHTHQGFEYVELKQFLAFYDFDSYTAIDNTFTLKKEELTLKLQKDNTSLWINGVKHYMIHPCLLSGKDVRISKHDLTHLIDPILRPHYIEKNHPIDTIIIDPGHGGRDPGSLSIIGTESELNLQLAKRLKTKLKRSFGDTVKIVLTRDSKETSLSLSQRINIAKQHPHSVILSIHGNSLSGNGKATTHGLETFVMAPAGTPSYGQSSVTSQMQQISPGNNFDQINALLGSCIHGSAIKHTEAKDRGLKRARFALVEAVAIPGVLIETGFLSHPQEQRKLFNPLYQEKITDSLVEGLVTFYNLTQFNVKAREIRTLIDMKNSVDQAAVKQ